ncbi:prolyl aminopeptidase [Saccharopolyspora griseoalba]|uniref:Proline iminopeptidase n=1 Tax=Saccharopolyspora griseoalba TaxID=1431848 RepID=A0ABW2LQ89_9PSEU
MRELYPELEPNASGHLDVGDGHLVHWEECGNPGGKPAVFLHGGPGGGSSPDHRRLFDPEAYRIVLLDQRGCGRSTPDAGAAGADLSTNTTWHLVADLERLREHLGIDRWQVFGGSWGSTLALAYAQTHPQRVTELVLRGIFTMRKSELDWYYGGGAANLFPERWAELLAPVPEDERQDLVAAYHRLLRDPAEQVRENAAIAWSRWEASLIGLLPRPELVESFSDPAFAKAFAGIEVHYFHHRGWLAEGQLIDNAHRLRGIPGTIVQGRYDVITPAATAWDLAGAWPEAELRIIPDAGHAYDEPGIRTALLEATDAYR